MPFLQVRAIFLKENNRFSKRRKNHFRREMDFYFYLKKYDFFSLAKNGFPLQKIDFLMNGICMVGLKG